MFEQVGLTDVERKTVKGFDELTNAFKPEMFDPSFELDTFAAAVCAAQLDKIAEAMSKSGLGKWAMEIYAASKNVAPWLNEMPHNDGQL